MATSTGGRDSPKPTASDGWITTGKGGKSLPIDQNKLRSMMAKVNSENVGLFKRLNTQTVLQQSASFTKHCAGLLLYLDGVVLYIWSEKTKLFNFS